MRNYIALLGWGYDETTTFMTTDELVERFALERVSKNPAVFDEQKLRWMNGRYMRELPLEDLHRRLEDVATAATTPDRDRRDLPEKMQTLADFWPLAGSLVEPPSDYDEKAWAVSGDGATAACARCATRSPSAEPLGRRRRSRRPCAACVDELG